jgi:hypothetical protein
VLVCNPTGAVSAVHRDAGNWLLGEQRIQQHRRPVDKR